MDQLNYKHLHYFWMVARSGGVAKAGERLHVTPQSISGQIRQLESVIGNPLWRRAGRKLELTDTGNLVLEYAERLFSVGEELKEALRGRAASGVTSVFRVGVSGAVPKVVAYRLIEPALHLVPSPRLECREGRMTDLLALLSVQQLDLVVSDRPMSSSMNVRGFNHRLLEGGISFLGARKLAQRYRKGFPQSLDGAPVLLPGQDSAIRVHLIRWFDAMHVNPRIIGDFDDTAVMKAFGQAGAGIFPMPSMVAEETADQFKVLPIGRTNDVQHEVYAISAERRLSHPAVLAISAAARAHQLALEGRH